MEAERRGILPDSKKQYLEEARKRGLVPSGDKQEEQIRTGFIGGDVPLMDQTPEEARQAGKQASMAIASPLYGVPYAGPALMGLAETGLSRGVDYLYDKPPEESFAMEAGKNIAKAYTLKGAEKLVGPLVKPILSPIEKRLSKVIRMGINKGIRPTVVGKRTAGQMESYYKKAENAVETIIENKNKLEFASEGEKRIVGRLPENLHQFSQSIEQTKKAVFDKYSNMIKQSGDVTIPLDDIVYELEKFSGNKVTRLFRTTAKGHAEELAIKLRGQSITLQEAQESIAVLNEGLNAFYQNPSYQEAKTKAIDAMVVNMLRNKLDLAVEGVGYQQLKNQYGALRSIEREVSHRAIVDARKNIKGLIDFADIASAAEAAKAISRLDPGHASASIAIKAMKMLYKRMNNPNMIIKNMFKDADKLISKRAYLPTP